MSQNQVCAIVSGQYADYVVHGYCTTQEQAAKAAAAMNDKEPWRADPFDVNPLKCLDEVGQNVEKIWYCHSVLFSVVGGQWEPLRVECRFSGKYKAPQVVDDRNSIDPDSRGINVFVWLEKKDAVAAKEAAERALHAWLKERED